MDKLGWEITNDSDINLNYKKLSSDEVDLIISIQKNYSFNARDKEIKNRNLAKEEITKILNDECSRQGIFLDDDQRNYLIKIAVSHIFGFGFLDELIDDEKIEEISIIGIGKNAYVFRRNKGWLSVNARFSSEEYFIETVNKMAKTIGRRITLKNPRVNAILANGSRIHATINPISNGELTIRKFRSKPFSPLDVINSGSLDSKTMALLSLLFQTDSNIIIAGNTASGKTTLLNSLFSFIPKNERILIIEETPEINIPHSHQVRMVSNVDNEIPLSELVFDSLRMRPDRTIVGEIRKPQEALALMDVVLAGQARGSYATMHARSVNESIQRLISLGFSKINIPSIDAILIQKRILVYDRKTRKNKEIRRLVEIGNSNGVSSLEKYDRVFNLLFQNLSEKLKLSKKELISEINSRENVILNSKGDFSKSFLKIQDKFFGI